MTLRTDRGAGKDPLSIVVYCDAGASDGTKVLVSPQSPQKYVASLVHSPGTSPISPAISHKQRTSEDVKPDIERRGSYADDSVPDGYDPRDHLFQGAKHQGMRSSTIAATAPSSQRHSTTTVHYPPPTNLLTFEPPSPVTKILTFEQHLLWVLLPFLVAAAVGALTFGLLLHFRSHTSVYIIVIVVYFALASTFITIVGRKMKKFAHRKWEKLLDSESLTTVPRRRSRAEQHELDPWHEWTLRRRSTERTVVSSVRRLQEEHSKTQEEEQLAPSLVGENTQATTAPNDRSEDRNGSSSEEGVSSRHSVKPPSLVTSPRLSTGPTPRSSTLSPGNMQIVKTKTLRDGPSSFEERETTESSGIAGSNPSSRIMTPTVSMGSQEIVTVSIGSQSTVNNTTAAVAGTTTTPSVQSLPMTDSNGTFASVASGEATWGITPSALPVDGVGHLQAHARSVEGSTVLSESDGTKFSAPAGRKSLVYYAGSKSVGNSPFDSLDATESQAPGRKLGSGEAHMGPRPSKAQVKQRIEQMTQAVRRQQQSQSSEQNHSRVTNGKPGAALAALKRARLEAPHHHSRQQQQTPYEAQVRRLSAVATAVGRPGEDRFPSYQRVGSCEVDSTFADADESGEARMRRTAGQRVPVVATAAMKSRGRAGAAPEAPEDEQLPFSLK